MLTRSIVEYSHQGSTNLPGVMLYECLACGRCEQKSIRSFEAYPKEEWHHGREKRDYGEGRGRLNKENRTLATEWRSPMIPTTEYVMGRCWVKEIPGREKQRYLKTVVLKPPVYMAGAEEWSVCSARDIRHSDWQTRHDSGSAWDWDGLVIEWDGPYDIVSS